MSFPNWIRNYHREHTDYLEVKLSKPLHLSPRTIQRILLYIIQECIWLRTIIIHIRGASDLSSTTILPAYKELMHHVSKK